MDIKHLMDLETLLLTSDRQIPIKMLNMLHYIVFQNHVFLRLGIMKM